MPRYKRGPHDLTALGRLIATAREQRGLTQQQLSDEIKRQTGEKLTDSFIAMVERGRRRPSERSMKLIGRVVGLDLVDMLAAMGYPDPAQEMGLSLRAGSIVREMARMALPDDWYETMLRLATQTFLRQPQQGEGDGGTRDGAGDERQQQAGDEGPHAQFAIGK